jgi:hypothetical protein
MKSKKIGILLEGDFYENEILYYQLRFPEEEMEVHFLTRLWGQDTLSFRGHEYQIEMTCNEWRTGFGTPKISPSYRLHANSSSVLLRSRT